MGFVAVGGAYNITPHTTGTVLVVKTDGEGTTQEKTIGFNTSIYGDQGYDVIQTSDGGYAVTGDHNYADGLFQGVPGTIVMYEAGRLGEFCYGRTA